VPACRPTFVKFLKLAPSCLCRHAQRYSDARSRELGGFAIVQLASQAASEIRLVSSRDRGLLSSVVFISVISANLFRPCGRQRAPIRHDPRPRRGKDAIILDGKMKLQPVPLVVRIGRPAFAGTRQTIKLLPGVRLPLLSGFIVQQPVALDHVQSSVNGVPYVSTMANGRSALIPTVSITSVSPS